MGWQRIMLIAAPNCTSFLPPRNRLASSNGFHYSSSLAYRAMGQEPEEPPWQAILTHIRLRMLAQTYCMTCTAEYTYLDWVVYFKLPPVLERQSDALDRKRRGWWQATM